jgi:hypothetical protein
MFKVLILLFAAGAGLLLVMWGRARPTLSTPLGPDDLSTPLRRELWRQGRTPGLTSTGAPSALMPVLAFEFYPPSGRLLYDRSRALDTAMFDLLREPDCTEATIARLTALQILTRGVRRQLLVDVLNPPPDPSASAAVLGRRLDAVAATIARLSMRSGA